MPDSPLLTARSGDASLLEIKALLEGRPEPKALDLALQKLQDAALPPDALRNPLELLFSCLTRCFPEYAGQIARMHIPLSRRKYEYVALLQTALDNFATTYEWLIDNTEDLASRDRAVFAERVAFSLSKHLYISHLASAPPRHGIWRRLHRAGFIRDADGNMPVFYREALLLAAINPASFSAHDLILAAGLLSEAAETLKILFTPPEPSGEENSVFWIDPERDFSLFAVKRREPPPSGRVFYFLGAPIAEKLREECARMESANHSADGRRSKKRVLRRLAVELGSPGKRRFARRRHSGISRAHACFGMEPLWALLSSDCAGEERSEWMVVNESPDGYALMLLNGKAHSLRAGEVVALRLEKEEGWLICMVRWVSSENPEHLEIGLQIVALNAVPALFTEAADTLAEKMAAVDEHGETQRLGNIPLVFLPQHPPLREHPSLLAPSGALSGQTANALVLNINGSERVIQLLNPCEQSSRVDIFAVAA
ncbi:MAG: hypothetical protein LBG69_01585 [Zoogloeaceae bacterium]|jgi:hypothetical protein|nr:hypothetical protein [Zoogloeaceae bacterium]